jgi:hypothetical protein
MLGRELRGPNASRRDAARRALTLVANTDDDARSRVIAELRAITETPDASLADELKVFALNFLSELGVRGAAKFTDPATIQRRSASSLAGQIESAADVAFAADVMLRDLSDADVGDMVEVMADVAPEAAARLAAELAVRLDAPSALHARVAPIVDVALADLPPTPRRALRSTNVAVLVDAAARLVVIASRKVIGERRWRRWAVLIGSAGRIDDCLHTCDAAEGDAAPLIATLTAQGYRVASDDFDRAKTIVAAAARTTGADRKGGKLGSPYYLGRDLLDLGDAHLGGRAQAHPISSTLGRAVELLAGGETDRAQALLQRCDVDVATADVAAATAACLLAQGRAGQALVPLARAIEAEPEWPLHHWNLAAALHALSDTAGCYAALRRFVATSAVPSGLDADPEHPARLVLAARLVADLERAARLAGTSLRKRTRRKRTKP